MNLFIFEARGFLPDALARALSGKDGTESLKYLRGLRDYVRHKLTLAYITVSSEDDAFLAEMGRRDISRFLRHLWVSQYGDLKAEGLFPALKTAIKTSSVSSLVFVQECSAECRSYVSLLDARVEVLENAELYVKKLIKGIDAQSTLPMLLSGLARFSLTEVASIAQFALVYVVRWRKEERPCFLTFKRYGISKTHRGVGQS